MSYTLVDHAQHELGGRRGRQRREAAVHRVMATVVGIERACARTQTDFRRLLGVGPVVTTIVVFVTAVMPVIVIVIVIVIARAGRVTMHVRREACVRPKMQVRSELEAQDPRQARPQCQRAPPRVNGGGLRWRDVAHRSAQCTRTAVWQIERHGCRSGRLWGP